MYSRKIVIVLSIAIIIGFLVGLINSVYLLSMPNRYFHYKMYRLLTLSLQKYLNKWVILSVFLLILLLVFIFITKFILKSLFANVLQIHVQDKNKLISSMFGGIAGIVFLYFGGSAINHHWLPERFHPLSLFGNICILLFAIFLGWILTRPVRWVLIRITWKNIFKFSAIRYIKITAVVLALSLVILNLYVYVYGVINTPEGPNVILISIDTLRADHLGCYGYNRNTSPHIDLFAKKNLVFKNCFVQEDWTLTSHMSILTSLYPPTHGVNKSKSLDPKITTLAEVLKNEGYLTLGFVRDCLLMDARYGFNQGFDSYIVKDYNPKNPELNAEFQNMFISRYLQKYRKKKVFLFVHYYDVHSDTKKLPYDSPAPYKNMFYPDYNGDFDGGFDDKFATRYLFHVNYYHIKIKEDDLKYIVSLYDAGIAYMDKCIGDLFDILRTMGLYKNSLIILTADHGEEFQEHGSMMHNSNLFYEQTTHVPLIVKLPGQNNKHREFSNLIESIDIMPSILDFLGVEKRPLMQGKGFFNLINNNSSEEWEKYIFAFGSNGNAFIRTKRWKLLTNNFLMKHGFKLFDLLEDPMENNDVINKYPDITENLKNELFAKYKEMQNKSVDKKVFLSKDQKEKLKALGYVK